MGPNQYSVTTGFGQRLLNSIIGIPIGLLMIIIGIGLLYWNEGRYDMSRLAKTAIEVPPGQTAPASSQGKLVAVDGNVSSPETLGDTYLAAGQYLGLHRMVEEYAWVEHTQTHDNNGGSQTTTYTYTQQWVDNVADSSEFKQPDGHTNPPKAVSDADLRVKSAAIGNLQLDMQNITLPSYSAVSLTAANAIPKGLNLTDGKLYNHNAAAPQVGDVRISYSAVSNPFAGVVFGKLSGSALETFADAHNHHLYRIFSGGKDDAVVQLHNEFRFLLWIFRGIGFVVIFIGLTMLVGPLTTLLDFFPTIGRIGGAVVGLIAFPVALLISLVTIVVGMIAHNPVALAVSLLAAVAFSVYFIRHRAHKHVAANADLAAAPQPTAVLPAQPAQTEAPAQPTEPAQPSSEEPPSAPQL